MEIQPQIEAFLRDAIGLSAASIGPAGIDSAVRERMRQCSIDDHRQYLNLLSTSAAEQEALIERIVVPETWFFRDEKPFEALKDHVRRTWLPGQPTAPLRVLSIPCASGEEPYSIAMSLIDLGLSPAQWHLDARDISNKALAKARSGRYGRHSFRGPNLGFRTRYFRPEGREYVLTSVVRESVNFAYGNLISLTESPSDTPYDLIFFRNLLIYLSDEDQRRALAALIAHLTHNGLLFLGHADALRVRDHRLEPAGYPGAFVYRKKQTQDTTSHTAPSMSPDERRSRRAVAPFSAGLTDARKGAGSLPTPSVDTTQRASELLRLARRCADGGSLDRAYRLCQAVLRTGCCRAAAYHLQGVIHEARDDAVRAEACFQRALSLEPDHYGALVHAALIAERRGDLAAASRLRNRAQRAEARQRHAPPTGSAAPASDPAPE